MVNWMINRRAEEKEETRRLERERETKLRREATIIDRHTRLSILQGARVCILFWRWGRTLGVAASSEELEGLITQRLQSSKERAFGV